MVRGGPGDGAPSVVVELDQESTDPAEADAREKSRDRSPSEDEAGSVAAVVRSEPVGASKEESRRHHDPKVEEDQQPRPEVVSMDLSRAAAPSVGELAVNELAVGTEKRPGRPPAADEDEEAQQGINHGRAARGGGRESLRP